MPILQIFYAFHQLRSYSFKLFFAKTTLLIIKILLKMAFMMTKVGLSPNIIAKKSFKVKRKHLSLRP